MVWESKKVSTQLRIVYCNAKNSWLPTQIFCANCSPNFLDLREFGLGVRGRLCHSCTKLVKEEYGKRKLSELWEPGSGRELGIAYKGNVVSTKSDMKDSLANLLELRPSDHSESSAHQPKSRDLIADLAGGNGGHVDETVITRPVPLEKAVAEPIGASESRQKLLTNLSFRNFNPKGVAGLVRPSRYLSPWVLPPSGKELAWKHLRSSPFFGQKLLRHAPMEHPALTSEESKTVDFLSTWMKRQLLHSLLRTGFSSPQIMGMKNGLECILLCLKSISMIANTVAPHVRIQSLPLHRILVQSMLILSFSKTGTEWRRQRRASICRHQVFTINVNRISISLAFLPSYFRVSINSRWDRPPRWWQRKAVKLEGDF